MTELANEFHSWIISRAQLLRHAIEGLSVEAPDDEHVVLSTQKAVAHVNFYELDPGMPEVVELNIVPVDDPENPTFFLHFEMDDLDHARNPAKQPLGNIPYRRVRSSSRSTDVAPTYQAGGAEMTPASEPPASCCATKGSM